MKNKNLLLVSTIPLLLFTVHISCEALKCLNREELSDQYFVECNTSCFTKKDGNGNITRGCLETVATDCKPPFCFKCSTSLCNMQPICKKCSRDDDACSTTGANDTKYNEICPSLKCLVKIEDKRVVRDCAPVTENDCNSKNCTTCAINYCNAGIFPVNRLLCNNCNGTNCNDVSDETSKPCLNYEPNEKCYTYGEGESKMQRGCQSDEKKPDLCLKPEANDKCVFCDLNNCNNQTFRADPTLKCIKCEGNKTDQHCFDKQDADSAAKCTQPLLYYNEELCYTHLKGESIERGCFHDRPPEAGECIKENGCETCTDNGCNIEKKSVEFTCIQCRSDLNATCRNEAKKFEGGPCRLGLGWNEGCFYGSWHGVIIRGCLIDADEAVQYICNDETNPQCFTCQGRDCNTTPASASDAPNPNPNLLLKLTTLFVILTSSLTFK